MIYKIITDTPLDIIKKELAEHSKEGGFGVLGSYEFQKILQTKGFTLDKDITVYELCNPHAAHEALQAMPEISVYLPCRISLYEENGKTVLATIDINDIMNSIEVDADFKAHMQRVFAYLQNVMNSWK
ncbi:MAG: hypothetical protein COA30_03925 [Sulfurimonas sp.]|nr:MAG: hypothetical protein COA30_03925 [Sulfurimonas sp.]